MFAWENNNMNSTRLILSAISLPPSPPLLPKVFCYLISNLVLRHLSDLVLRCPPPSIRCLGEFVANKSCPGTRRSGTNNENVPPINLSPVQATGKTGQCSEMWTISVEVLCKRYTAFNTKPCRN